MLLTSKEWARRDLAECRELAATYRTYGDWFDLRDRIRQALESVREDVTRRRLDARRYGRTAEGWERESAPWSSGFAAYWRRDQARATAEADELAVIRDEFRAALRYMVAEDRREAKLFERLRAEAAEREVTT